MLVFIDQSKNLIHLYSEKQIETFEFDEIDDLAKIIGKKPVLYVTSVLEATAQQIVDTVNALIVQNAPVNGLDALDQQTYYLQSTQPGILHVQDINVTFNGPGDCKFIDEEMAELIQESVILRALIKKEHVKVVDYATMQKSSRKQQRTKEKFQKLRKDTKDKELDSIIIKSDRPGSALDLAAGMFNNNDDNVITTDITDSIINDPTEKMTPEQLNEAIKTGKLAT